MHPDSIAILGGGLTGLSAAFHLSRRFPTARITIIDKDTRFGGWARSERVKFKYTSPSGTQEEANVLFETGPRALRANALSVLELIHLLDLAPSIVVKRSAAEKKYSLPFFHIPGSRGIHRVPTSLLAIINPFQPAAHLSRIFFSSVLLGPFRWGNKPSGIEDESVDAFYTRRFGAEFARVFGSALTHGSSAGDSRKLSMRAVFPSLWDAEERGHGSVLLGHSSRTAEKPQPNEDTSYELGILQDKMHSVSSYTFKDGIGMFVDAVVDYLQKQPNIQMYGDVRVMGLCPDASEDRFKITTSSETLFATHVVSALPLYELEGILSPATPLPHLTGNAYSSATVVHLVFPRHISTPEPHPDGFGYLVSRPAEGYSTTKGSGILGCVFDPRLSAIQDTTSDDHQGIAKMTVTLGGPYFPDPSSPPQKVDIPALVSELSFQLDRPLPSPLFVKVYTNVGCMPAYAVGNVGRMEELKRALASEPWNGRMEVVGAGVAGASMCDCVEGGRNVGRKWGL